MRINPDVLTQTLPGISTGKKGDKFGIPQKHALGIFQEFYDNPHLDFKGIDFHIGSQVLNVDNFAEAFGKMRDLVLLLLENNFNITHIDCGGGLGVPYHPAETAPNIETYAELVKKYFGDLNMTLAFEPGRFISANAGIMVAKILYTKHDTDWDCLIVDSAMNDLARPAMYGAYHHIIPVVKNDSLPKIDYDIVGPVCESTDTFAKKYAMQQSNENDLIAFLTAGAYGASMASTYNSRLDIPEVLVHSDKTWTIIRKRPDYDDLMRLEL